MSLMSKAQTGVASWLRTDSCGEEEEEGEREGCTEGGEAEGEGGGGWGGGEGGTGIPGRCIAERERARRTGI